MSRATCVIALERCGLARVMRPPSGTIRTTQIYAQVSQSVVARTKSPLDVLATKEGHVLG